MPYIKKRFNRKTDRTNWFVCVSNIPEQMEHLKITCKEFRRWFYIEHQPDTDDGKLHIHFLVMYSGSCRISTASKLLDVPENMVQPCFSHKGYAKYMIHLNEPNEKIKYKVDDVKTNFRGLYKSMICEDANDDVVTIFNDIKQFHCGKMSFDEFVERHSYELQTMPLYQKIQTYKTLYNLSSVRPT